MDDVYQRFAGLVSSGGSDAASGATATADAPPSSAPTDVYSRFNDLVKRPDPTPATGLEPTAENLQRRHVAQLRMGTSPEDYAKYLAGAGYSPDQVKQASQKFMIDSAMQAEQAQTPAPLQQDMSIENLGKFGSRALKYIGRREIPFSDVIPSSVPVLGKLGRRNADIDEAKKSFAAGTGTPEQAKLLAQTAREDQDDAVMGQNIAGKIVQFMGSAPKLLGEIEAGGALARGGGALLGSLGVGGRAAGVTASELAAGGKMTSELGSITNQAGQVVSRFGTISPQAVRAALSEPGLAKAMASKAGQMALMTPLVPSMWVDEMQQRNQAAGRDINDWRGAPAALAHGALQMMLIGSMQAKFGLEGSFLGKTATKAGIYVGEQAATDSLYNLASQTLTGADKFNTKYGTFEKIMKGQYGEAGSDAIVQAFTGAIFAGLHEAQHDAPPGKGIDPATVTRRLDAVQADMEAMHKAGVPPKLALQRIADMSQRVQQAATKAETDPQAAATDLAGSRLPGTTTTSKVADQAAEQLKKTDPFQHLTDQDLIGTAQAFGLKDSGGKKPTTRPEAVKLLLDAKVDPASLKSSQPAQDLSNRTGSPPAAEQPAGPTAETPPAPESPTASPAAPTPETGPVPTPAAITPNPHAYRLPAAMSRIAPRYGYGLRNFEVKFESDFDRATYTLAQKTKNKSHDAILESLKSTGLSEAELIAHGNKVRQSLKESAKAAEKDATELSLPAIEPSKRPGVAPAATPPKLGETPAEGQNAAPGAPGGQESASPPVSPVHAAVRQSIDATPGLSEGQKAEFHAAADQVFGAMPQAAHAAVAANLKGVKFYATPQEVLKAHRGTQIAALKAEVERLKATNGAASEIEWRERKIKEGEAELADVKSDGIAGGFDGQTLHLDGASKGSLEGKYGVSEGSLTPNHIAAHELGHAIDGPDFRLSKTPEWFSAWYADIKSKKGEQAPLTEYGAMSRQEGFAEFSRILYGSDVPTAKIEADFPHASAYFRKLGLWPAERSGTGTRLAELFDKRVATDPIRNPAAHVDLGKGPLAEPAKVAESPKEKPPNRTEPAKTEKPVLARKYHEIKHILGDTSLLWWAREHGVPHGLGEDTSALLKRIEDKGLAGELNKHVDAVERQDLVRRTAASMSEAVQRRGGTTEQMNAAHAQMTHQLTEGVYKDLSVPEIRAMAEHIEGRSGQTPKEPKAIEGPAGKPEAPVDRTTKKWKDLYAQHKAMEHTDAEAREFADHVVRVSEDVEREFQAEKSASLAGRHGTANDLEAPNETEPTMPAAEQSTEPPKEDVTFGPLDEGRVGGAPLPPKKTALANEETDAARAEHGLPEIELSQSVSDREADQKAQQRMADDPQLPYRLVEELLNKPRPVDATEGFVLLRHRVKLSNDYFNAQRQATFAQAGKSKEEADVATARAEALLREIDRADRAIDKTGTETGRALRMRRRMMYMDYSLANMMGRALAAKGEALTPQEQSKITEMQAEIDRLIKKLDEAGTAGKKGLGKDEAAKARIDLEEAKRKFEGTITELRYANLPRYKKILRAALESSGLLKTLKTAYDLSAVFRQGGWWVPNHPKTVLRAFPDMLRQMASKDYFERSEDTLRQRANAPLYQRFGLLTDMHGPLNGREEAFMSRWLHDSAESKSGDSIVVRLARLLPKGIVASERAFTGYLNRLRADVFDTKLAALQRNAKPTDAEIAAIANYVGVATGRGPLGARLEKYAADMNMLFFSPKYAISRFQLLAGQPLYGGSARTRMMIAKDYARVGIGLGLFYLLAGLDDEAQITFDPRSTDFGKIRWGNTRIDPLTGISQAVVFFSRGLLGEKKTAQGGVVPLREQLRYSATGKVPYGGDTEKDVLANFFRNKLAPIPSAIADTFFGETTRHELTTASGTAENMATPMVIGDVYEAMLDQGMPRGAAISLLAILGMGSQVYEKHKGGKKAEETGPLKKIGQSLAK